MHEQIVMTPKCKTANSTTIMIERRRQAAEPVLNGNKDDIHIAGGDHKGIIINKQMIDNNHENKPAQISLKFIVFLVDAQNGTHSQEQRTLFFWFPDTLMPENRATVAQDFFKELVSPLEFPRDYVGFIKKIMKLVQNKYTSIDRIEIELKQIDEPIEFPVRPVSTDETILEGEQKLELSREKVLELIESAYPNPLTTQDLAEDHGWDIEAIAKKFIELEKDGLVMAMDKGAYTRAVQKNNQIKVVKQMPQLSSAKQPTIAIITAQYCEKLAVDSMIENKETFVRYTTVGSEKDVDNTSSSSSSSSPTNQLVYSNTLELDNTSSTTTNTTSTTTTTTTTKHPRRRVRFGESNVYTLGDIGAHRIVCTKLPTVGHTREAMTAAGNTTTRLLGTFQKVDYVFLVGVGGGVPHYTDYKRHVRLGDVVVSYPIRTHNKVVYMYCEDARVLSSGGCIFDTKEYSPTNLSLQNIASEMKKQANLDEGFSPPWQNYMREGLKNLINESEHNFEAPPAESDKLYMNIGEQDVIEVSHPSAPKDDAAYARSDGCPQIHLAPIASGRRISRDDQLRQKFASRFGCLAFDAEMDAVVDSILGNCRDSFAVVRGIADYKDGSRGKEWQPYASLAAASVVKAMISAMDPPSPMRK
uniref:Winged helix-turn-helix domain-containing protein n=1 Tax=Trichogramma kaykai TaxID=54128 RepID=A0ABD2WWH4_9HYME